jgi:DNA-binding beta-propeller fold protein YncE
MAVDLGRKHLFVAELGNDTVDVIDLASGKTMHRIEGLKEPQGIGYAPKPDVLAIANAGDGSVRLFRGSDFVPLGTVALGDDADNIRLDPNTGQFVVGYGAGGLAILDPASGAVVARAKLSAHPESFQLDPATRRAFVNVPNAHEIAVVDLAAGRQAASWPVGDLRANFPMARDAGRAFLAVVFRDPARLVLLDAASGTVKASIKTCSDADDVFVDAKRRRIYVSCGEGSVDVLQQEAGGYKPIDRIKTASGARTSLFVPELDRLFVAARAGFFGLGSDAAILVLRPDS